jgi:hypothetical protein
MRRKMSGGDKKRRIEDEFRVWGAPEPWSSFHIVTVHALANQTELLKKLNTSPEQCDYVGVHWLYLGHIYFFTLWSVPSAPGTHCWRHPYIKHNTSFTVRTLRRPITTTRLEIVLRRLSSWIDNERPAIKLTGKPKLIIDGDILMDA